LAPMIPTDFFILIFDILNAKSAKIFLFSNCF